MKNDIKNTIRTTKYGIVEETIKNINNLNIEGFIQNQKNQFNNRLRGINAEIEFRRDNSNAQGRITIQLGEIFPDTKDDWHNLTREELERAVLNLNKNFLEEGFGKVFKFVSDKIDKMTKDDTSLSQEKAEKKFEETNYQTPWNFINDIFESYTNDTYKFNYKIQRPKELANEGLIVKIENTTTNEIIQFENLSSGEKILLTLTLFLYQKIINNAFPKVLLLDEIDAVLHPSMCEKLIKTLKANIVDKGTKIILATHNASTIAFCDEEEDGIFIKNLPNIDNGKIEEQSKEKAIEILSSGYITLNKGLTLFDKLLNTDKELLIFTEGYNTRYIKKAIDLINKNLHQKVEIIKNLEGITGKNQLKTLFQFFQKITHQKNILFVWDCDVTYKLEAKNNTIPFTFDKNENNQKVRKGIENLFSENLFTDNYYEPETSISDYGGKNEKHKFIKNKFMEDMLKNDKKEDFENFEPLLEKIRNLIS